MSDKSQFKTERNKSRSKKGKFIKTSINVNHDFKEVSTSDSTKASKSKPEHADHSYCCAELPPEDNFNIDVVEEVCVGQDADFDWQSGRRIVEVGVGTLAENLKRCSRCPSPLYLHNILKIRNFGLGSVFEIICSDCGNVNNIQTGKKHGKIYDMNTKLALAMLHSGVGITQINSILTTLNIPAVNSTMLVRRQSEAGQAVEMIAKESGDKYLQEEVKLGEDRQKNEIEVSVDAGWQKRGSGRAYDSLSGHCSMIGVRTGKVLSYAVRSKTCRVCSSSKGSASSTGKCKVHDCRKNWIGSAKAMEPDMVADMIKETSEKGEIVTGVVGDDDATTAARLKSTISHPGSFV